MWQYMCAYYYLHINVLIHTGSMIDNEKKKGIHLYMYTLTCKTFEISIIETFNSKP